MINIQSIECKEENLSILLAWNQKFRCIQIYSIFSTIASWLKYWNLFKFYWQRKVRQDNWHELDNNFWCFCVQRFFGHVCSILFIIHNSEKIKIRFFACFCVSYATRAKNDVVKFFEISTDWLCANNIEEHSLEPQGQTKQSFCLANQVLCSQIDWKMSWSERERWWLREDFKFFFKIIELFYLFYFVFYW